MQTISTAFVALGRDLYAMGIFNIFPVIIALIYICLVSLLNEPARRNFNAIMVAGAGAAYLNGGFGPWEFAFTTLMTFVAYRGLQSYRFIGVGWLLHTVWDALHHLYGNPIVSFAPASSLGCFVCDPLIALWCFAGGFSVFAPFRGKIMSKSPRVAIANKCWRGSSSMVKTSWSTRRWMG